MLKSTELTFQNQKEPGSDYFTSIHKEGPKVAEIVILEMMALNERSKGLTTEAYKSLNEAISLEEALPLGYGPPIPAKPSKELLGDFLFKDKQFLKACGNFQEVLLKLPNRREATEKIDQIDPNLKCPKKENIFYHRLMNLQEN